MDSEAEATCRRGTGTRFQAGQRQPVGTQVAVHARVARQRFVIAVDDGVGDQWIGTEPPCVGDLDVIALGRLVGPAVDALLEDARQ